MWRKSLKLPSTLSLLSRNSKKVKFLQIIAVYIYRYVITLSLWNKYDIGHYSRFAAHILANPCEILRCNMPQLYFVCNNSILSCNILLIICSPDYYSNGVTRMCNALVTFWVLHN